MTDLFNRTNNTWIIEKHTNSLDDMIFYLKIIIDNRGDLSSESIKEYLIKAKEEGIYKDRYGKLSSATLKNKIGSLRSYNLGIIDDNKFLKTGYGDLVLKYRGNQNKLSKILFTNLWFFQYPHPKLSTNKYSLYPMRLIFTLMMDKKLNHELFADEIIYFLPFIKNLDSNIYNSLVDSIINFRNLSPTDKSKLFDEVRIGSQSNINKAMEDGLNPVEAEIHASKQKWADLTHQILYYLFGFLLQNDITLKNKKSDYVRRFKQDSPSAKSTTLRNIEHTCFSLNPNLLPLFSKISDIHPLDESVITNYDSHKNNYIFSIVNRIPQILLDEIEENNLDFKLYSLNADKISNIVTGDDVIKKTKQTEHLSSHSEDHNDYEEFEKKVCELMNLFQDIKAKHFGGGGKTDVECYDLLDKTKFNIDTKARKKTLNEIMVTRLKNHRVLSSASFTLVIASAFAKGALSDIHNTENALLRTDIFTEFVRQSFIDGTPKFHDAKNIIIENLGEDVTSEMYKYILDIYGTNLVYNH